MLSARQWRTVLRLIGYDRLGSLPGSSVLFRYREWRDDMTAALDVLSKARSQLQAAAEAEQKASQALLAAKQRVSRAQIQQQIAANTL